jgi:thiol-disulfide isomerase/thioredoxin
MMIGYPLFPRIGLLLAAVLLLVACDAPMPVATHATPAAIKKQIEASKAPLVLVHVWATWCDPCREEFPEIVKVMKRFQPLETILISADAPSETATVEAFLAEHGSPAGSLVSTELNQAFIESLSPQWAGSLPATFFFQAGKLVREWEGKRTFKEYEETIESLLKK